MSAEIHSIKINSWQDVKAQEEGFFNRSARVAAVGLSFIALASAPVSLSLGGGRVVSVIESCVSIFKNAFRLALFLLSVFEFGKAAAATQIPTEIFHSRDELGKGNYLEAAGHIEKAVTWGRQLYDQAQALSLKTGITQAPPQNNYPFELPPGEWETEAFDIYYITDNFWGEWDRIDTVYAAREKDGSRMVFYFTSRNITPLEIIQTNGAGNSIAKSKKIVFNVLEEQPLHITKINRADFLVDGRWNGTCFQESLGSGTWKAESKGGNTVLTVSFNQVNNDEFFENVKARCQHLLKPYEKDRRWEYKSGQPLDY